MKEEVECVGGPLDGKTKLFVGKKKYFPIVGLAPHIFKKGQKMVRGSMGLRGWHVYEHRGGKYHYAGLQQDDPEW